MHQVDLILHVGELRWRTDLFTQRQVKIKSNTVPVKCKLRERSLRARMIFLILSGSSELKFQLACRMHCQISKYYCDRTD